MNAPNTHNSRARDGFFGRLIIANPPPSVGAAISGYPQPVFTIKREAPAAPASLREWIVP